jgi:hypothetical protein
LSAVEKLCNSPILGKMMLSKALQTPTLDIFEEVLIALRKFWTSSSSRQTERKFVDGLREKLFKACVYEDWTAMAIYLLEAGAPIDS